MFSFLVWMSLYGFLKYLGKFHELRSATASSLSQRSCFPHWEISLQKKLWCFLNYCFRWLLFPSVYITQKIWVFPGLWYSDLFFLFRGIFFSTCVHFLHTQKHKKKEFGVTSGLLSVWGKKIRMQKDSGSQPLQWKTSVEAFASINTMGMIVN